jgi:hypothetical protein
VLPTAPTGEQQKYDVLHALDIHAATTPRLLSIARTGHQLKYHRAVVGPKESHSVSTRANNVRPGNPKCCFLWYAARTDKSVVGSGLSGCESGRATSSAEQREAVVPRVDAACAVWRRTQQQIRH